MQGLEWHDWRRHKRGGQYRGAIMLVAVVGPSGAGKDTVMEGARAILGADPRFVFARRAITRAVDAGGEAHDAMTREAFEALRCAGGFALSWPAHGLLYGIPRAIESAMADGRVVVANLSRGVLGEAASRYPLRVLNITAPLPVLAARLALRGREDAADIAARLARESALPDALDIVTVMNDRSVADGVRAVCDVLNQAAADARPTGTAHPAKLA